MGETQFRQCESLTAVVWQDKRPVNVISTLSQPGAMELVSRRQRDGSRKDVMCPSAIATYTQNMGGVDLGDQLRKYYSVRLKCTKNYKYVFWFIFDVCITNAYVLSGFVPSSNITLEQGRLKNVRVRLATIRVNEIDVATHQVCRDLYQFQIFIPLIIILGIDVTTAACIAILLVEGRACDNASSVREVLPCV